MPLMSSYVAILLLFVGSSPRGVTQVSASGVFEINLEEFVNEAGRDKDGNCCDGEVTSTEICSKPCRTSFSICFTHSQSALGPKVPCTFGSYNTSALDSNHLGPEESNALKLNPVSFKFNLTWPGTFSLVIEARHHTTNDLPERIIARIVKRGQVGVNLEWRTETQTQNEKILRYSYRVRCDKHYYGEGCSEYCHPRDDVYGHYTCDRNGRKTCLSGWQGSDRDTYCTKPICLPGCNESHGYCKRPNECLCHPGWHGTFCNECQTYPGCAHGTCIDRYECKCDPGWGGMFCNLDLNYCVHHKPCKNGARCTNAGQGSYACECKPGYTGRNCETELDECNPNPCRNGAKCTGQVNGGYICKCTDMFFGINCEITHVNCKTQPCMNGGICTGDVASYSCKCKPEFGGRNCEIQVVPCSPTTCRNGGSCINRDIGGSCRCPRGFAGKNCEKKTCHRNFCRNGGECSSTMNERMCNCSAGFTGIRCEHKSSRCHKNSCSNNGKCIDRHNGDYACECAIGFSGKNCEKRDHCSSAPCKNGGTCYNYETYFSCQCRPGSRGDICEILSSYQPSSLLGSKDSQIGLDSQKGTRIIVLTKNDSVELNTSQWIAVCLGSGFLVLILVAIAACVGYHKRSKSAYKTGRLFNSLQTRNGSAPPAPSSDPRPENLYIACNSKSSLNSPSHENPPSGATPLNTEIVVVPSSTLSSPLKYPFKSRPVKGEKSECLKGKSSAVISCARDEDTVSRDNMFHPIHEPIDVNVIGAGYHEYKAEELESFINPSRQNSETRHTTNRLRLPTYQEACKNMESNMEV